MSRHPRLIVPGAPHHVVQRGTRRERVFFGETDYQRYLQLFEAAAEREGLAPLAHCLMPNHVHLIVVPETPESLSRAMARTHRSYAEEVNHRFGWSGHLWQERFGSCPMDERHARNALRYVLSNPVRAGLTRDARDWPWSNARALLMAEGPLDHPAAASWPWGADLREWLMTDAASARFTEQLRLASRQNRPLGSDEFLDELEQRFGRPMRPASNGRKPRPLPFDPTL